MKKVFFYLPLAALALAACSSDEVVTNVQQNAAINGDQLQIAPTVTGTTRATSTTTATLSAFQVYIDGKFQKGEEDTNLWDPQVRTITKVGSSWNLPAGVEYWWADKSTTAKFTGVAPAILTDESTTAPTTASISVENEIANQVDYLVAYNEGVREDFDAGVPMNFQHVMSQIIVKALNKNPGDIEVKVAGMKLVNAKSQNTLTLPATSTANGTFDWADYTPWQSAATTSATYNNGVSANTATTASTLTGTAVTLADPMLLMPQQLVAQDLAATATAQMTNNYLAILVKVTGSSVGYRDIDGHYYTGTSDNKVRIPFTAKREGTGATAPCNTYLADEIDALSKGLLPETWLAVDANTGDKTYNNTYMSEDDLNTIKAYTNETVVYKEKEVIYPRVGYGTSADNFAYVGVALDQEWKPGYKYTYTLNFSKDGIGKSIADQPAKPEETAQGGDNNYPYGLDLLTGEAGQPGEDIVDNPTQLFFTVTVDEWIDADAINKEM